MARDFAIAFKPMEDWDAAGKLPDLRKVEGHTGHIGEGECFLKRRDAMTLLCCVLAVWGRHLGRSDRQGVLHSVPSRWPPPLEFLPDTSRLVAKPQCRSARPCASAQKWGQPAGGPAGTEGKDNNDGGAGDGRRRLRGSMPGRLRLRLHYVSASLSTAPRIDATHRCRCSPMSCAAAAAAAPGSAPPPVSPTRSLILSRRAPALAPSLCSALPPSATFFLPPLSRGLPLLHQSMYPSIHVSCLSGLRPACATPSFLSLRRNKCDGRGACGRLTTLELARHAYGKLAEAHHKYLRCGLEMNVGVRASERS